MDQMTKQTETSVVRPEIDTAKRIVGIIFGVMEILLGLRLVFALLGANPDNGFIKAIHFSTQFIVGIFESIFAKTTISEANNAVFEPATLIAMVIVGLIGWVVLKLMASRGSNRVHKTEYMSTAVSDNQRKTHVDHDTRL